MIRNQWHDLLSHNKEAKIEDGNWLISSTFMKKVSNAHVLHVCTIMNNSYFYIFAQSVPVMKSY